MLYPHQTLRSMFDIKLLVVVMARALQHHAYVLGRAQTKKSIVAKLILRNRRRQIETRTIAGFSSRPSTLATLSSTIISR
jgi:hypothetical protein